MTNTVAFNPETLNTTTSQARQRATSFDLILFRIPDGQYWDEGVGYDFADLKYNYVFDNGGEEDITILKMAFIVIIILELQIIII